MNIRFWGTRGSVPAAGRWTQRYGGNTSCVELRAADFVVDSRFVRDDGKGLSDHDAIGVAIEWTRETRVARR